MKVILQCPDACGLATWGNQIIGVDENDRTFRMRFDKNPNDTYLVQSDANPPPNSDVWIYLFDFSRSQAAKWLLVVEEGGNEHEMYPAIPRCLR